MKTTFDNIRGAGWALTLTLLLLTASAPALAQTGGAGTTGPAPSKEAADTLRLVTEFEVNGLKVMVKRREGSQSVVAGLFLRGGARNVTAENAGVEALMLDVATEASQKYPLTVMRRELARTGTGLSYGVNVDYSVLTLASTRRHFDRSWDIFVDSALHPSFTPEDFERVKARTLVGLSDNEDTPDSFLQELQSRVAYAGHPYLNNPRGTVASVTGLTLEQVRAYHQRMMQTSRMLLVVVGDVDPQEIRRKVESSLGKLPKGDYKSEPLPQLSFAAPTVA